MVSDHLIIFNEKTKQSEKVNAKLSKTNKEKERNMTVEVLENGTKKYYCNGELHRDNDLPAIEYVDGTKCWYQNGKLHRDNNDLPVIENVYGEKFWYKNGFILTNIRL